MGASGFPFDLNRDPLFLSHERILDSPAHAESLLSCFPALGLGLRGSRVDWDAAWEITLMTKSCSISVPLTNQNAQDGTKVAEWLTARGYSRGTLTSLGGQYYGTPWVHYYSEQPRRTLSSG